MTAKLCICSLVPPSSDSRILLLSYLTLSQRDPGEEETGLPVSASTGWQLRMAAGGDRGWDSPSGRDSKEPKLSLQSLLTKIGKRLRLGGAKVEAHFVLHKKTFHAVFIHLLLQQTPIEPVLYARHHPGLGNTEVSYVQNLMGDSRICKQMVPTQCEKC